ncbi:MAG TPA: hypothetical protein DEP07_22895 [Brevibacillus sp.]|nr:hypothetical protein EDM60_09175 [Brevibacillus parabrevis]HBZ83203.1 hypothetical protein [Brevibacillus sp.]
MTGAAFSHVFANDYGDCEFSAILPLFYSALNLAAWALHSQGANFREVLKINIRPFAPPIPMSYRN